MERFEGNGAECMVRFIAGGCKGSIWLTAGEMSGEVFNRYMSTTLPAWLFSGKCAYTPPEPVWRDATPGQALDAWLAGKTVQRQANSLDDAFAHGDWYQIEPRTSAMPYSRWDVQNSKYRVLED